MIMYYVIGLPLGIVLTFVVRMGIMGMCCEGKWGEAWEDAVPICHLSPPGLWLGMLACGLLGAAAFAVYTARMDWKLAAEEVSVRRCSQHVRPQQQ